MKTSIRTLSNELYSVAERPNGVTEITLKKWIPFDTEAAKGDRANMDDCNHIVTYDCDVVLPNSEKLVFRKSALPTLIEDPKKAFKFFKKIAKSTYNDARGAFAGSNKYLHDKADVRFTKAQLDVLRKYLKTKSKGFGEVTSEDQLLQKMAEVPKGDHPSPYLYMRTKVLKFFPGWGDEEGKNWWPDFVAEWKELNKKDQGKLADKVLKHLKESNSRGNRAYSAILGSYDRSNRIPYARPAVLTTRYYDEFASYKSLYQEVDSVMKDTLPDKWELQHGLTDDIDEVFSLFGTAFTTITLNWETLGCLHFDGRNFDGGVGILSAVTQGEYQGKELLFPELGLAFDIRDGDFIAGDTTNLMHGNLPYREKSDNAERVSFVWYCREGFKYADSYECEQIRKKFLEHMKNENKRIYTETGNLHPYAKSKHWSGIFPDMWRSQEWVDFKAAAGHPECSCTNYKGS